MKKLNQTTPWSQIKKRLEASMQKHKLYSQYRNYFDELLKQYGESEIGEPTYENMVKVKVSVLDSISFIVPKEVPNTLHKLREIQREIQNDCANFYQKAIKEEKEEIVKFKKQVDEWKNNNLPPIKKSGLEQLVGRLVTSTKDEERKKKIKLIDTYVNQVIENDSFQEALTLMNFASEVKAEIKKINQILPSDYVHDEQPSDDYKSPSDDYKQIKLAIETIFDDDKWGELTLLISRYKKAVGLLGEHLCTLKNISGIGDLILLGEQQRKNTINEFDNIKQQITTLSSSIKPTYLVELENIEREMCNSNFKASTTCDQLIGFSVKNNCNMIGLLNKVIDDLKKKKASPEVINNIEQYQQKRRSSEVLIKIVASEYDIDQKLISSMYFDGQQSIIITPDSQEVNASQKIKEILKKVSFSTYDKSIILIVDKKKLLDSINKYSEPLTVSNNPNLMINNNNINHKELKNTNNFTPK